MYEVLSDPFGVLSDLTVLCQIPRGTKWIGSNL
jgi:hypothetical protein